MNIEVCPSGSWQLRTGLAAATVVIAMAAVGTGSPATAAESVGDRTAASGTIETLVGPGVCPHGGRIDETSTQVRTLAVDAERATVFVDTGAPELGEIAAIDVQGRGRLLRTGVTANPAMLASDGSGGVLVAAEDRVEWVQDQGMVTVAGDQYEGTQPSGSGDGGPASLARFAGVQAIASDADGNLYLADAVRANAEEDDLAMVIRLVNRTDEAVTLYEGTDQEITVEASHIDTIAGTGATAATGDARPALRVGLPGQTPAMGIVDDRLYVAAYDNTQAPATSAVHMVNLGDEPVTAHGVEVDAGHIATVAGGAAEGYAGEGVLAADARFGKITGLAGDDDGHAYVADPDAHRIRRIDAAGAVSTFAGTGPADGDGGFNGNNQLATDARLDRPHDVAVAGDGRVFITDRGNAQLRTVDDAGLIQAAPGNGLAQTWRCAEEGGGLRSARDSYPVDGPGRVAAVGEEAYFTAVSLTAVYRTGGDGKVTVAFGNPGAPACPEEVDCPDGEVALDEAPLGAPDGVAADGRGGLYVMDVAQGGRVWLANLGNEPHPGHGQSLPAATARIVAADMLDDSAETAAIDVDGHGNVYVADGYRVQRLDGDGQVTTLVERLDEDDRDRRAPAKVCCGEPSGLAATTGGGVYVADTFAGGRVWLLNTTSEPIAAHGHHLDPDDTVVVAGADTPLAERDGDRGDGGPATDAELVHPRALTVDPTGRLYLVDAADHTIRSVDTEGTITTVAGSGSGTFNGDGLPAGVTALAGPTDLAVDACDNLLIVDAGNRRLRHAHVADACPNPLADATQGDYDPTDASSRTTLVLAALGTAAATGVVGVALVTRRR